MRGVACGGHRWSVWLTLGVTGDRNQRVAPSNPYEIRVVRVNPRGSLRGYRSVLAQIQKVNIRTITPSKIAPQNKEKSLPLLREARHLQHVKFDSLMFRRIIWGEFHDARPSLDRLCFQETDQSIQRFLFIILLERVIVCLFIFLINDHGGIVVDHQPVVQ